MNRVEKLIRKSFLELLKTQSFYNIHVKDILEQEHVSRTSFYKYYKDKYDLLDSIENDLIDEFDRFIEQVREANPDAVFVNGIPAEPAIFTPIFQFATDHYDTLSCLFGANGDGLFFDKLIRHITDMPYFLLDNEALSAAFTEDQWKFINAFLAYGYLGIILNWFRQGKKRRTAEEMGEIMSGIVKGFFGNIGLFTIANPTVANAVGIDFSQLDLSSLDFGQFDLSRIFLSPEDDGSHRDD